MFLIYDIEIIKAIKRRDEPRLEGIEYCDGFHDHQNCGISVICAYDYKTNRYRVFAKDNFQEFADLADRRYVIGFNSRSFDDNVCRANGIPVSTSYDLLVELWAAAGLGPQYEHPTHAGFGLDATAKANDLPGKTGHGALAPVQWQRGEVGNVIDYCLEDVRLTKILFDLVQETGRLRDPRDPDQSLCVRRLDSLVVMLRPDVQGA